MADSTRLEAALASTATVFGTTGLDLGLSERIRLTSIPANGPMAERLASLDGAFAVVAGAETYGVEILDQLPQLCLIARSGVGFDQIDIDAASRLGIHVTTTPGVNAQGVAEHTIALLLHLTHRISHYDARVRGGQWRDGTFFTEVQGMTVGIIGFGHIGRATAALLNALGANVVAFDALPIQNAPGYVTVVEHLADLLPQCQAISIHAPLLDSTRGLIGSDELALLPPGAFVINAARGGILDEVALEAALRSSHIAGAGLDVFATEPPRTDSPLLALDTCVFSPHSASLGAHTIELMTRMIATQLNAVADGATPAGTINVPNQPRFPAKVR